MKKIIKYLRRMPSINAFGRRIIKAYCQRAVPISRKLIELWPVSGITTYEFQGDELKLFSQSDDALTSKLYYLNAYENNELKLFQEFSKKANIIFDIGANIGLYTIIAGLASKKGKVVAFEPNPFNFERLEKNVSLNNLSNVKIERLALGKEEKTICFNVPAEKLISDVSSIYKAHTISFSDIAHKEIDVRQVNLDSYVQQLVPDLIKIDVELHELDVLLGGNELLMSSSPVIFCEVFLDIVKITKNPALREIIDPHYTLKVEEKLKELGFYFYLISNSGILRVENLRSSPDYRNFIFSKKKSTTEFLSFKEINVIVQELSSLNL